MKAIIDKFLAAGLFNYEVKLTPEVLWGAGLAGLGYLISALPSDWATAASEPRTYWLMLGMGLFRIVSGLVFGKKSV